MSILAAQYVRMSTDLQQYSIENQKEAILQYALQHEFAVIKTYTDASTAPRFPHKAEYDFSERKGKRVCRRPGTQRRRSSGC